jgi:hypothetical protein
MALFASKVERGGVAPAEEGAWEKAGVRLDRNYGWFGGAFGKYGFYWRN